MCFIQEPKSSFECMESLILSANILCLEKASYDEIDLYIPLDYSLLHGLWNTNCMD